MARLNINSFLDTNIQRSLFHPFRQGGMDGTSFFEWKRRFQTHGLRKGMRNRPVRGDLLSQDTMFVGNLKGVGKVYLHACIDTYGSYAFGFLHTGKKTECAAALVHNDVLPFYQEHGLSVGAILTDNSQEFCGTDNHPFELYLALNDISTAEPRSNLPSPLQYWTLSCTFCLITARNQRRGPLLILGSMDGVYYG